MSHYHLLETDDGEFHINVNSDWSGNASVHWEDTEGKHEVELPGKLLLLLGRKAAIDHLRNKIIEVLENE